MELSRRLCHIFLRGEDGHRPVFGESPMQQEDTNFRDNVLFYEFFHGDTGRGLGASHQTGWTAVVAVMLHNYGSGKVERAVSEPASLTPVYVE